MNFKDIIGPDELDWKVIPLDWKKIGKDELKLGTPMSKDGLEANDASCYGILMDDVAKGKHFQARVIVSGCVDFDKAEAYSGVKVSEEAKKAIGKVWSQAGGGTGPIDPKRLPEGYPYKEQGATILDVTHEFPALRGQQFSAENGGLEAGKVYAVTVTAPNGSVIKNNITAETGEGYTRIEVFYENSYMLGVEYYPEDNVFDITDSGEGGQFTITIEAPETIHPMAEEFLPEGYPYKESTVVNAPLDIIFDRDSAASVVVNDMIGKYSDIFMSNEDIQKITVRQISTSGGDDLDIAVSDVWDDSVSMGGVTDDVTFVFYDGFPLFIVVRKANAVYDPNGENITFPETGIYLVGSAYSYVSSLTTTEPVEQRTQTIHPMAPEFLPAGVGGGAYVMELKPGNYSMGSGGMTVPSVSYDPILDALNKGQMVFLKVWQTEDAPMPVPMIVFYVALDDNGYLVVNDVGGGVLSITFQTGKYTA